MSSVRRWYIYLVSAISLQGVAWATIALLRNLLISGLAPPSTAIAFEIAVIVIGLPVFLVHWLWGQRLAENEEEERASFLRRLYLYGMMSGFLGPFVANAFDLIGTLLQVRSTIDRRPDGLTAGSAVLYHLLALLVMGVLWVYHRRTIATDAGAAPEQEEAVTVRRLYILGFSAWGLTMVTMAIIYLVRWMMMQFGDQVISSFGVGLTAEITRLVVGVPLWLIFWRWAQRLFDGQSTGERTSALRKVYLYGAIFVGAIGAVANATRILAALFRFFLGLPPRGDVRAPLSIIVGMAVLWAFHALVIRDDAEKTGEAPRQAGVRRLYAYLIAGTGLAALLIGLGGDVSVIIRSLDSSFGSELREQLAWFTAAIIAGLPVWVLPWRQLESQAHAPGPDGTEARRSLVRRIYVYLFLFIATMTALSGTVYVVYQVLSWVLGGDAATLNELGQAIAFSLIAVGVWLYHGSILRGDQRLSSQEQARQLTAMRVTVVDLGDGHFARALVTALKREAPGLDLVQLLLDPAGAADPDSTTAEQEFAARLADAELIVGPWTIAAAGVDSIVDVKVAQAVVDSPAQKLLIPVRAERWEWAGVDRWDEQALVQQTVHAIKQIIAHRTVEVARPLGAGAVVLIVIGVLILLGAVTSAVVELLS